MLIEEYIDDRTRVLHFSDTGMMILQHPTEILYESAVDNVPCLYTYEETDKPIETESFQELENESRGKALV